MTPVLTASPAVAPASLAEVAAALDALVRGGPLSVAFQPIVDLASGAVAGYEVLGRAGAVAGPLAVAARSPATLLDVAHRHGRLLQLDRRWREIAVAAIALHPDPGHLFFLNVDPRLTDAPPCAPGFTLALIERHGLSPARFVLELTEAPSRDPGAIERVLEHYAEQGFRVALDDLGAGQQTLTTLIRLRPHIVKLDRALIRGVDGDPARAHLLGATTELARRDGIAIVAEGIETEGQLRAARDAGIAFGQGFLLGRPAPRPEPLAPEAPALLAEPRRRSLAPSAMPRLPRDPSPLLLRLVDGLRGAGPLEDKLSHVTRSAAALLGVERVSLRLLDAGRARLLVAARAGEPLHDGEGADFAVGEGLAGWVAREAAPLRVDHAEHDPRFAPRPGRAAPIGSFLGAPLLGVDGCIGVLATSSPRPRAFTAEHERWLRVVADVAAPYLDVARLQRVALTDPLTLAQNRRALLALLPDEGQLTGPISVLLCDLDDFKHLNDRLGHAAGDEVLCALVRTMSAIVRRGDRTVRLGGEEFLLVLPGAPLDHALAVAERVRDAVASAALVPDSTITVSIGVAERLPGEGREALLQRADEAMYDAKRLGKNRVRPAAAA
jgi:diguanylate cyclase (GGDEF)-like protein